jgi:hypothetical protein
LVGSLKTNKNVTHLDIRGNSIRADGSIAVGQMLKVNSAITFLSLEWNCIGIWESGVRGLADALSMNQTLVTLDLRNNKIGPQGAQALALSLKHNTSLRKLDLRWNNAGLIGGRAFVDLLKMNLVLKDLNLTGNEVPDDVCKALEASLERNESRYQQQLHSKSHTETLSKTLQELTISHQDMLSQLSSKLASSDQRANTLSQKLELASQDMTETHESLKATQARVQRMGFERKEMEDTLTKERTLMQSQLASLQKELVQERQQHMNVLEIHNKYTADNEERLLRAEANLKKSELDAQVLSKDKSALLEELSRSKERERNIVHSFEEKIDRLEAQHQNKLVQLHDSMDKDFNAKIKRLSDKERVLESEKLRVEEVDMVNVGF